MKRRETLWFCLILAALLGAVYVPQAIKPGGITFGTIQDFTNVYGFYPWDTFTNNELRAGYFPLWNPHNALGEPHLANMQSAVFYPLTWIKVMGDMNLPLLDMILVLRLFLAGLFTYWFLGDLKSDKGFKPLGFWGRAFGAAAFATTGYFTRYVYMSHLNVEILIPLILFCFGRLANDRGLKWFVLSSLAVWLSIVGGFPEATLYTLMFGAAWFFYCRRSIFSRGSLALIGALVSGGILSLPQLLPFIEYMVNAWFYHPSDVGTVHLILRHAFTLLVPWYFGTNDISPLVPWVVPYVGMGTVAFAFMGKLRKTGPMWFFIITGAILAGIIYGIPPFIWLGKVWPLSVTLNFKYAVPVFAFCICVLAGLGMDEATKRYSSPIAVKAVAGVVGVIVLMLVIDFAGFFEPFRRLSSFRWIWYYAVLLGAIISLPKAAGQNKHGINMAIIFLFLIYPASGNRPKYDDAVQRASRLEELDLIEGDARFAAEGDIMFPNMNLLHGKNDIRYYSPMYLKNYVEIFKRANGLKTDEELARNFDDHDMLQPLFDRLDHPLWAKMGLGYWIGDSPYGWENAGDNLSHNLYKRQVRLASYQGESCDKQAEIIFRSSQVYEVFQDEEEKGASTVDNLCPGGRLVTSFARYPGWKAYSGEQIKIGVTDGVFQTTEAMSRVQFKYQPASFAIGLWAFMASIAFMLTMAILKNTMYGKDPPDPSSNV